MGQGRRLLCRTPQMLCHVQFPFYITHAVPALFLLCGFCFFGTWVSASSTHTDAIWKNKTQFSVRSNLLSPIVVFFPISQEAEKGADTRHKTVKLLITVIWGCYGRLVSGACLFMIFTRQWSRNKHPHLVICQPLYFPCNICLLPINRHPNLKLWLLIKVDF